MGTSITAAGRLEEDLLGRMLLLHPTTPPPLHHHPRHQLLGMVLMFSPGWGGVKHPPKVVMSWWCLHRITKDHGQKGV